MDVAPVDELSRLWSMPHGNCFIYMDVAPVDELSRLWSTQHGNFILKMLTKFWPVVAL